MTATQQNIDREALLSRKELASRWGVCIETLKRWEKSGRLPFVKMGQRLKRYRLSDVTRLEAEMHVNPGA